MGSFLSPIFRHTILYDILAPKDSITCIRALNDAPLIDDLRKRQRSLLLPEFISQLPERAQKALRRDVADAEHQFDACKHGLPLWKIADCILVAWLFAVLPSIEGFLLGEQVFLARNLAFFAVYILELSGWIYYRYTTRQILVVMIRERVGILLPIMLLYIPPAFAPGYRYLYEETWYTVLTIVLTALWLYVFQFHSEVARMLELRAIRRQTSKTPPPTQVEEQIIDRLSSLLLMFDEYDALMAMYKHSSLTETMDSLQKGRFVAIKNNLVACLPEQTRSSSCHTITPEQQARRLLDRKVKTVFSVIAILVLLTALVSLWGFWLSVAQSGINMIYVAKIFWLMVVQDHQSLDRFFGVFNALIVISMFIFAHVSIPLFIDKEIFDKNLVFWLVTIVATLAEYLLLTKPTVAGMMWICTKMGVLQQKSEVVDQPEEGIAQEKAC